MKKHTTNKELEEKAANIKHIEKKIVMLKLTRIKNTNPKKAFRINESLRAHQIIRDGLLEAFWS